MTTPPPVPPPIEPPSFAPISPNNGSIIAGCLTGCAIQIGFFALGALLSFLFESQIVRMGLGKYEGFVFMSWGLTQWIGIIPMIRSNQSQGKSKNVQGLIITGAIGVLLSTACASMLSNLGNMH